MSAQDLNSVSKLKNDIYSTFRDIPVNLESVSEKFNDDYILALYCIEEDSTIFGMAMGDFHTDPKYYQLSYKNSQLEIKPRYIKDTKDSVFRYMNKEYVAKIKDDGFLKGLNVYVSPITMKRWGYIAYINKESQEHYNQDGNAVFAYLRFGSIDRRSSSHFKNNHADDWLDNLFWFCFGLSCC